MNLPDIFLTWQSAAVALVIYVMTECARRAVQSVWKSWKGSPFYTEFVLFATPPLMGALLANLAATFPWPKELTSLSSRVMYSAVLGLFAGAVYGWAKRAFAVFGGPQSKA